MTQNPKISVETFLETLGESPYGIAQSLHKMGVTGIPGCATRCVIAWALKEKLELVQVFVTRAEIRYKSEHHNDILTIPLPWVIARFIAHFDEGRFPGLLVK